MARITVDLGAAGKATVEVGSLAQEETLNRLLKIAQKQAGITETNTLNTRRSQDELDNLGESAGGAADALEETATTFEDASDQVEASAKTMANATATFKKDLKSQMFQNTKSLFSGVSSPMEFLKDSASNLGKGFGGLLEGAASAGGATGMLARGMLMLGGPITLLVAAVGAAIAFLVGRAKKNLEMYDKVLKSGATFAGGLEQFRDTVTQSSLNLDDFTAVLEKSKAGFALFGGTVQNGAIKFAAVSKEVGKFGVSFRNLGYNAEEMGEVQAEYMEQLARTGDMSDKNARSDAVVAKGAMDYARNLKLMSTLTGQTTEDLRAQRQEKTRDYRIQYASRMMAKRYNMDATNASNAIQNLATTFPGLADVAAEAFANNGEVLSEEGQKALYLSGEQGQAMMMMIKDMLGGMAKGQTSMDEINTNMAKKSQQAAAMVGRSLDEGTLLNTATSIKINGLSTTFDGAVEGLVSNISETQARLSGLTPGLRDSARLEKDRNSAISKQNAMYDMMYTVQKKATDFTDKVAIDGMKTLQEALIRFIVAIYENVPFMDEMPDSLKAMRDAMDADALAQKKDTLGKKLAEQTPGQQTELARATERVLTPQAMQAAAQEENMDVNAGAAGGIATLIGGLSGMAIGTFFLPGLGTALGASLGASIGGSVATALTFGNEELEAVTKQRDAIRQTEAGRRLSDEELNTLIRANYEKQGYVLDEAMSKVTKIQTPTAAPGTARPQAPASAPGTEKPPHAARGGILSGATSGFAAVLHGTEAVVPLPDNKSIPVTLNASGNSPVNDTMKQVRDLMMSQNELLASILDHTKTSVSVQKDIRTNSS